jgi:hypothetical protein
MSNGFTFYNLSDFLSSLPVVWLTERLMSIARRALVGCLSC